MSDDSPREARAWDSTRLASNPHKDADKAGRVREMFSAIAPAYDLNNRVHSLWLDQYWRRATVAAAAPVAGTDVLDVACGTGDLAAHFARAHARSVVALDYTKAMLDIGKTKALREGGAVGAIRFIEGDAQDLPFSDSSFDIVSIAFGIRNVADPARAIREFHRVLRPGGRLAILEFGQPTAPVIRSLHGFYTRHVMPWTATLLARDRSGAYRYLPRSVETFLTADALAALVRQAGFATISQRSMTLGTCVLTVGTVA